MSSPAPAADRSTPRSVALRALTVAGVGVVIVLALVAVLTALRTELPRTPGVMSDALGPENGEPVDDYLARAASSLRHDGEMVDDGELGDDGEDPATGADAHRWALVTAARPWSAAEAAAVVRSLPRVSGLYVQVPVDGVAMPVTGVTLAEPVSGESGREPVFDRGLDDVAHRLDAVIPTGPERPDGGQAPPDADRAAKAAALTAARIRSGEPAIIGLLARGTPAQLSNAAGRPSVRAVEALPPDAVWQRFAVRPLQPQQMDAAFPLPDDAPVPSA